AKDQLGWYGPPWGLETSSTTVGAYIEGATTRPKLIIRGVLFAAVMEYALRTGTRRVGGVIETFWLPHFAAIGWRARIQGLPQCIAGSMTLAAFVDVDEDALRNMRAATGWTESVLRSRPDVTQRFGT